MKTVYFRSRNGARILVRQHISEAQVGTAMIDYIEKNYPNRKIYYWRSLEEGEKTIYDFGSYIEFFEVEEEK